MTTTGNGIFVCFVCYDDIKKNKQAWHAMPFQYKSITTTNKHGVVLFKG
jgi:hypothetical protein